VAQDTLKVYKVMAIKTASQVRYNSSDADSR